MCGIAGYISKQDISDSELLTYAELFAHALKHRGPDEWGYHIEKNKLFVNTRLAIVDIKLGHQPMYSDNKLSGIVYNGEVYNYQDLKKSLKDEYNFYTNTDTEVVLRMYEKHGLDAFSKLDGMFACCVWDNNKVVLARDMYGAKPLYVYEDSSRFIFSSELQTLLNIPNLDLELDYRGLQDYLCFRYTLYPYTLFTKIRKLAPGECLIVQNSQVTSKFFYPAYCNDVVPMNSQQAQLTLSTLLLETTQKQLMGEVPIGVLLSGGVDSSLIAALLHKQGANLKTFSIGFPDLNEFSFSREITTKYGFQNYELCITVDDIINEMPSIMQTMDEPFSDAAVFPLYILSKEMKKHVKVVLSGEGSDEFFGGYHQYVETLRSKSNIDPYLVFLQSSHYFLDSQHLLYKNSGDFLRFFKCFKEPSHLLNQMLYHDQVTWLPEDLMMKTDKVLMQHSLEGRFPFLTHSISMFSQRLDPEYKINSFDFSTKVIVKKCAELYLSNTLVTRPKMGFSVPIRDILKKLQPLSFEILEDLSHTSLKEIIRMEVIKQFFQTGYQNIDRIDPLLLWNLLILLYWCRAHLQTRSLV